MTQHVPKIENPENEKNEISPILAKKQEEAEKKEYYDPLKRYAQRAEDEGSNIERNPLNNHKLIQNSYFPMSRLIGSYWNFTKKSTSNIYYLSINIFYYYFYNTFLF